MYPSEYAYQENSVYGAERSSANCRNYPTPQDYIHCDGTPLRLTDSDIGSQYFTTTDYYKWLVNETRNRQLLFIFPTRVNVTTITLHYYSSSGRGLPRLRFYAVPDDFDVWEVPATSYIHVDIAAMPPSEWLVHRRNVSTSFKVIRTSKILMVKFSSSFSFAVSELEFFSCCCKWTVCMYIRLGYQTKLYTATLPP